MAFWSDKSLPKAAETTIANSVSPLARSIRSPLQQFLLMTITLSAEMEAFTVAGWQEEREGGCISYVWVYGFICMMLPRFSLYREFLAWNYNVKTDKDAYLHGDDCWSREDIINCL